MIDLGVVFTPFTALINRRLKEQTGAREIAEQLEGETMAIRVADLPLAIFLQVIDGGLKLRTHFRDEPAVTLTGSPIALATLATGDSQKLFSEGRVRITGDAMMALRFQTLIKYAQPDLEDELANVVGDTAAHQAGRIARGLQGMASVVSDQVQAGVGSYLTERQEALPTRGQYAQLREDVEALRDDIARAEARARILTQRLADEED